MRCIARGSLPTRRKADAISMSLYHCSLVSRHREAELPSLILPASRDRGICKGL